MLNCADVSDDPLASAVGLANYSLADEFLKLTLAHFQIGMIIICIPSARGIVDKYCKRLKGTLRKYYQTCTNANISLTYCQRENTTFSKKTPVISQNIVVR